MKRNLQILALCGATLLLAATAPNGALAKASSSASQIKANEKVVEDFEREVLQAHNPAAASKYYAPDIIQHNPNVPGGLDGFQAYFSHVWKEPLPVKATMDPAPAILMGQGDLVLVMVKRSPPDPTAPGQTYDTYWFDLFRVQHGKIVEHWDAAAKPVPKPS